MSYYYFAQLKLLQFTLQETRNQETVPRRLGVPDGVVLERQVVEVPVHVLHHAVLPEELRPSARAPVPLAAAAPRHASAPPPARELQTSTGRSGARGGGGGGGERRCGPREPGRPRGRPAAAGRAARAARRRGREQAERAHFSRPPLTYGAAFLSLRAATDAAG